MRRLSFVILMVILASAAAPVSAQDLGYRSTVLAEIRQTSLPVGPLYWQGLSYRLGPADPPVVRGDDVGFTLVVDGLIDYRTGDQPARLMVAGEAAGTVAGAARAIVNRDPDGSSFWFLGLGGPTPHAYWQSPEAVFQSESIVPPGPGAYVLQLTDIVFDRSASFLISQAPGSVTFVVVNGALHVALGDGGGTLQEGDTVTLPANLASQVRPVTAVARVLALSVTASDDQYRIAAPPSTLPEYPQRQLTPNMPLLPSTGFPRGPAR